MQYIINTTAVSTLMSIFLLYSYYAVKPCDRKLKMYKYTQPLIGMPEPLPETGVLANHIARKMRWDITLDIGTGHNPGQARLLIKISAIYLSTGCLKKGRCFAPIFLATTPNQQKQNLWNVKNQIYQTITFQLYIQI